MSPSSGVTPQSRESLGGRSQSAIVHKGTFWDIGGWIVNVAMAMACGLVLAGACTTGDGALGVTATVASQVFEFSSGGAYHPEGFGAWQLRVDQVGNVTLSHQVGDEVTNYGPFQMTVEENDQLWRLVRATNLDRLTDGERLGLPDEIQYTFRLAHSEEDRTVKVWASDALADESVRALLDYLSFLIANYTGCQPVLA